MAIEGWKELERSRECYRGPWSVEKAREGFREPSRGGKGQGGVESVRVGWRGPGRRVRGKEGRRAQEELKRSREC